MEEINNIIFWDRDKILLPKLPIINYGNDYMALFTLLGYVNQLIANENLNLPEPILELDADSINLSWFRRKYNAALYFSFDLNENLKFINNNYSINLLKDNKAKEIINPNSEQILELIKSFLQGKSND